MKAFMNIEDIELVIEKIETYRRLESGNFSEILDTLDKMNYCYYTNNTHSLEELQIDIGNMFNDRDNYTDTNKDSVNEAGDIINTGIESIRGE